MLGPCLAGERQHQAGALLSTCTMGVVLQDALHGACEPFSAGYAW